MLTLGKLTDYAIVVTSALAPHGRGQATARALAEETHIPLPTVIKLLKVLAARGVLESIQGRHGGYRLARAAAETSLIAVIEAVEGPVALTECNRGGSFCRIEATCGVHRHWLVINATIRTALAGLSIADLSRPVVPLQALQPKGTVDAFAAEPARRLAVKPN
jgi:FeS assembly SUF system regulator